MSEENQASFDPPEPGADSSTPAFTPASDAETRLEPNASRGSTPGQAPSGSRPSGAWQPPTPEELEAQLPQFKVLKVLGRGGMGAVYKGWQTSLDRQVAIKILPPDLDDSDANFSARFKQEARTMARLLHPGIVRVFDAGETASGLFYFVMEFVEGGDVAQLLKQQGKLQQEHALAITSHVCDALAYAHEHGVIHRDIKPANIMINQQGQVKVADFGLAKSMELGANSGLTKSNIAMGTPDFIAPEALITGLLVDHRADLYAVGVMLYNMLTGEIPRGRCKMPSQKVGSDARFDAVINKAMETEREDRYQSAREIRHEMDAIQSTPLENPSPPIENAAPARKPVMQGPGPPQGAPASRPAASPSPPRGAKKVEDASKNAGAPWKNYSTVIITAAVLVVSFVVWILSRNQKPQSTEIARTEQNSTSTPGTQPAPQSSFASQSLVAATKDAPFVNSLGMKFVPVPIIGGPTNGKQVLFSVWVTRVQDYEIFANETKRKWAKPTFEQGLDHPAVMVNLEDAKAFCGWITLRERAAGKLAPDEEYRLPSDHEWSCAAGIGDQEDAKKSTMEKLGRIKVYPWGTSWPPTKVTGNFAGEETNAILTTSAYKTAWTQVIPGYNDGFVHTSPVGRFAANRFALYDMGGNVSQWCGETWDVNDKNKGITRGISWSPFYGGWEEGARLFVSFRNPVSLDRRESDIGFRCVLVSSASSIAAATPAPPSAPPSASQLPAAATKDSPFVNSLGMKFVPVPGTNALFSIWHTRVSDYTAYAKAQESAGKKLDGSWRSQNRDGVPIGRELDHPVSGVSWSDAQAFCQWLTEKETTEGKLPKGLKYRLPSDEEWSWAVGLPPETGGTPAEKRGKHSVDFPWGKDWPPTKKVGNFADETFHTKFPKEAYNKERDAPWIKDYTDGYATASPVGSFPANAYGLYDMTGNVWQWCGDWFDNEQKFRVLRGASWGDDNRSNLRSSYRHRDLPGIRHNRSGFRCVLGESAP